MKLIAIFCLMIGLASCGSDGADTTTPSAFFGRVTEAVSSVSTSVTPQAFATPECDESGSPTSSAEGDAAFPGEQAFCTLNTNSQSPDTIQGSYFLVSKVLCAVEKTISFNYGELPTINDNISISETDDCFGEDGFDLNDDKEISGSFTISLMEVALPDSESEFDFYIGIQIAASYTLGEADPIQFYLKDSDGVLAARIYQPFFRNVFDFSINSGNNSFSYENKDFENERHIRFYAEGTFSGEGAFTSVESAKFIQSEGDSGVTENTVSIMNFTSSGEEYDHHINGAREPGFSVITDIPHDIDFYTWAGRTILDADIVNAGVVDYSTTFDMSF